MYCLKQIFFKVGILVENAATVLGNAMLGDAFIYNARLREPCWGFACLVTPSQEMGFPTLLYLRKSVLGY